MRREKPSREGFSALCQNGFPRPAIVVLDGWRMMHSVNIEVKAWAAIETLPQDLRRFAAARVPIWRTVLICQYRILSGRLEP